ncbi:MAG: ABC transporter substrate-binding protein [Deltaproteobacteria bacterium]|nr:ABC transporter substrate-binding protein [Deltaproteobacteria bacterium]
MPVPLVMKAIFRALSLTLLGLVLVAARLEAGKQVKIPRVGLLWLDSTASSRIAEFRKALRNLGYLEGHNMVLEFRNAEGKRERLPELAAELLRLKVDVIVSDGADVIELLRKLTRTIPIVMPVMGDPIARGIVANPSRPEANITGLTNFAIELSGKRLDLLREAVPGVKRVAVLSNLSPAQEAEIKELEVSARSLGIDLTPVSAQGPHGLKRAFEVVKQSQADALMILPDTGFLGRRVPIVEFGINRRLPAIFPAREFAEAGGLMSYGPDILYNFYRAATYVDKILKGAKPQDLPVENPMKFEFIINLKTARKMGLTIPAEVLMRADEVIR